MSRPVVVTGAGVVSPIGSSYAAFGESLGEGRCGLSVNDFAIGELSISVPSGPVRDIDARLSSLEPSLKRADRVSQMAALAADEALAMAGLEIDEETGPRTACVIGSGIGGQATFDDTYYKMLRNGRKPHPLTILRLIPNAPASHVSIRYRLTGPSFAVSSACSTASHAIGLAADMIAAGRADAALAGASEAVLTYGALEAWSAMRILSDEPCRPFSKNRRGLTISEGSGIVVLETEERARARGAPILARVAGVGMNADGKDMINPSEEGAASAMRLALDDARIDPDALYINAHGTGTLLNDPTETRAIRRVFGADADRLLVSSTKSMHGHLLGAAGGAEAIACLWALREGAAPPTINYDAPDPACDLNVVPNEARPRAFRHAVSNSFAFGGLNAALLFEAV